MNAAMDRIITYLLLLIFLITRSSIAQRQNGYRNSAAGVHQYILPVGIAPQNTNNYANAAVASRNASRYVLPGDNIDLTVDQSITNPKCSWRFGPDDNAVPYGTDDLECCDTRLESIMRDAIALSITTPKLGDSAKFVQRRIQVIYRRSFEVIIANSNFALSSYYHGPHTCKIYQNGHYIVAYETPNNYDPFNLITEELFAAVDAQEKLGSTKPLNVRGKFKDARKDPSARDDLSIQPSPAESRAAACLDKIIPHDILFAPVKFPSYLMDSDEGDAVVEPMPNDTMKFPETLPAPSRVSLQNGIFSRLHDEPFSDINAITSVQTIRHRGEGVVPTPNRKFRQEQQQIFNQVLATQVPSSADVSQETEMVEGDAVAEGTTGEPADPADPGPESRHPLPAGTHCDKENKGGNKCCNGILYEIMKSAMGELESSPQYGPQAAGTIANIIKKRVQQRFNQVYEVFVSGGDFAVATHSFSDNICKFEDEGMFVMAYETPRQGMYDPEYKEWEDYFSAISRAEPLGSTEITLPGQRGFHTPLRIENGGPRAGFPVGSHCDPSERAGSLCCSLPIFQSIYYAYNRAISEAKFNPFNKRNIAQKIRDATEETAGHSMEVMISTDDFAISSHGDGQASCKIRVDMYYISAYETPVPYALGDNIYADNGDPNYLNCPTSATAITGASCCDGALYWQITRAVDEVKHRPTYNKYDTEAISRAIARAAQRHFHTTFETVVSRTDFVSKTNKFGDRTCKLDVDGYHAMSFESSKVVPDPNEFADPPAGGGGGSGGGGGGGGGGAGGGAGGGGGGGGPGAGAGSGSGGGGGNNGAGGGAGNGNGAGGAGNGNGAGGAGNGGAGGANGAGGFGANGAGAANGAGGFGANGAGAAQGFAANAAAFQNAAAAGGGASAAAAGGGASAAAAAAAAGGGGACFSTDTWVTTPNGKRRMDQLDVGDYVLSANLTHTLFVPITLWMHREPEVMTEFTTIMTEYGKTLALTEKHLIFRHKCDEDYAEYVNELPMNSEAVFADELEVGDCMFLNYKGRFRQQRLMSIKPTRRKGIFAPLTSNGRIIVNDMVASCYSDVKEVTLQTTYFSVIAKIRKHLHRVFGSFGSSVVELPIFTQFSKELLKLAIPFIRQ